MNKNIRNHEEKKEGTMETIGTDLEMQNLGRNVELLGMRSDEGEGGEDEPVLQFSSPERGKENKEKQFNSEQQNKGPKIPYHELADEHYEEYQSQHRSSRISKQSSENPTELCHQESRYDDDQDIQKASTFYIYVLANPFSGSRKAARFVRDYGGKPKFIPMEDKKCFIHVYDLVKERSIIFESLKTTILSNKQKCDDANLDKIDDKTELIVAVMGGDGTLGTFLDQLCQDQMLFENLGRITFVPLPYGTGNDLGRSLGWGSSEGKWARSLKSLVEEFLKAKRDKLAIWEAELFCKYTEGWSNKQRVKITEEGVNFKKIMCCYFNLGVDAIVSNTFELYRSGNKHINNMIYTFLSVKHLVCCCNPFSVKDFVESVSEVHGDTKHTIFSHDEIPNEPFVFLGTNLPSFYGGLASEQWHKSKNNLGLPQGFVEEEKLGPQYYHDNKVEILGQHSRFGLFVKQQIKRFCQLEGEFQIDFRQDIPKDVPFFFAIDGENFVMNEPSKIVFKQFQHCQKIRILRGPKRPLRA